jgi:hypothetical protein
MLLHSLAATIGLLGIGWAVALNYVTCAALPTPPSRI